MSRTRQETIRCSRYNAEQPFTVWESINVTVDPKLKKLLLDGGLTTFRCNRCGNEAHVSYDCLYHDMDRSLAIWLKEADDDESEVAKQVFLTATQIKTSRTVRTMQELYDKIRIFDDGLDDFEIELFKFFTCIRQQMDLSLPFHYAETQTSFFGRKSLAFAVAKGGKFDTISCSFKDYEAAAYPVAKKVRPLVRNSAFQWAYLNRSFILQVLEDGGLMQAFTPATTETKTVRVHMLGRPPKIDDRHQLDDWLFNGGKTYKVGTWRVGVDVSADQAGQYRDAQSGDLYVYYQIVDGQWKGRFVSRQIFMQLKSVEDAT